MTQAVISAFVRSPFHFASKGQLASVRSEGMVAQVIQGLIKRTEVDPGDIEDLILGCAFPEGEQGLNMGRLVVFMAGLPLPIAGVTVNRFCGSSMEAIHMAAGAVALGAGEAFICAGVESMSHIPMGGYNPLPNPYLYDRYPEAYISMGETAENVSQAFSVSREDQEIFAYTSHQKAAQAQKEGAFAEEIIPIDLRGGFKVSETERLLSTDGCIRPNTTLEALAELKPAFDKNGLVTAGTSSPLTDGAVAVLVCSEEYAKKAGLPILARIKATAKVGCEPELMGMGPVYATQKVLKRAGLDLADIDVIELNEAFASQALAVSRELGLDPEKVNIDGGAIALGHPLGASGARITGKAAQLLHRRKQRYALATMCIGGGQGIATILEAVS